MGYQATHRLVGPIRQPQAQLVGDIIDVGQSCQHRAAVGLTADPGRPRAVVLVSDLADQLFDQVLDGDDTRRAPVLVDDHRHVHARPAQPHEQFVGAQGLRYPLHRPADCRQRAGRPGAFGHGERVPNFGHPDDVVDVGAIDREAGEPARSCRLQQGGHRLIGLQAHHLDARGHRVFGGHGGEPQGAPEQAREARRQRAFLGRGPHHRAQLRRCASAGQLLLGFDPHRADDAVRQAVEGPNGRGQRAGEAALERHHGPGYAHRLADRPFLGHELAEDELGYRGEQECQRDGDGVRRIRRQPRGFQRLAQQACQGGLGDIADQQARHGDPELRAGELEGQLPKRPEHARRPPVGAGLPLDDAAVDGDQRELGGDEDPVAEDQQRHGGEPRELSDHVLLSARSVLSA